MTRVDVVFFVEHADRELEIVQRMADRLAERGISSLVCSVFFDAHRLLALRAKVFVFPYVMGPDYWPVTVVSELYGHDAVTVNLNWEQLLSVANRAYKRPRTPFQREQVYQLAWDDGFREYLEGHEVRPDRIHVLGNPARDILSEQIQRSDEMRTTLGRELGLDTGKVWVFFPMNYGWAFTTDLLIRTRIAAGYDPKVAWEYQAYSRRNLALFLRWTAASARKTPSHLFIVRPHPAESPEQWVEQFECECGGVPDNVVITRHRSVREWLPAADAVFSSWSTVAFDAFEAGMPAFLIAPEAWPDWLYTSWYSRVPKVVSTEEFDAAIAGTTRRAGASGSAPASPHASSVGRYVDFIASLVAEAPEPRRPRLRTLTWRTLAKLAKVLLYSGIFRVPALGRRVNRPLTHDFFGARLVRPVRSG